MPTLIYNPCEEEIFDPVCDPCLDDIEHGRIRSIALIHKSYKATIESDPENPNLWADGLNAKLIFIIPETLGSFDGGSPVEATGYGDQSTKVTGYNFVANYKDPNYKALYTEYGFRGAAGVNTSQEKIKHTAFNSAVG